MASTNGSGRPSGCVSIPVEIIRDSNTTGGSGGSHSRHNSPYRTLVNDSTYSGFSNPPPLRTVVNDSAYSGFSNSPPWPPNTTGRFQPRHSPAPAYDRVISNSQFNQPINDHSSYQKYQEPQYRHPQQQMYEPGPSNFSRSSEDLLSSPFDSMRYSTQMPPYSSLITPSFSSGFRNDSDFVQPTKYSSPLRRSYDALNNFTDMHQSFPTTQPYPPEQQQQQQQQPYYRSTYQTQHQPQPQQQQQQQQPTYVNQNYTNPNIVYTNEYGAPMDHYQPNTFQGTGSNILNDRSRSPTSQRGASPARPPPATSQQQQQQQVEEPELKMAKDTDGPIPMPAPASSNTTSSSPPTQFNDQQVPSTGASASTNAPSPPSSEPVRDPNTIALEKLEQMKQNLDALEKEVDAFDGSNRKERAYKLLDEQGLKIMICCDELVDVSADIKEKRKEMIYNVQRVIGKLESKVPATPAVEQTSNPLETTLTTATEQIVNNNQGNIEGRLPNSTEENVSAPTTTTTTEQSISS